MIFDRHDRILVASSVQNLKSIIPDSLDVTFGVTMETSLYDGRVLRAMFVLV